MFCGDAAKGETLCCLRGRQFLLRKMPQESPRLALVSPVFPQLRGRRLLRGARRTPCRTGATLQAAGTLRESGVEGTHQPVEREL